jgi:hypothetical protein
MSKGCRINFNAIVKALTPKEQESHKDEQLCYNNHKLGHRLRNCLVLQGESSSKADKQE